MDQNAGVVSKENDVPSLVPYDGKTLSTEQKLETFKFYEEAAEKNKGHAWTQTAWVLTLNAGILVFSLNFYADHAAMRAFLFIEFISAVVGVILCAYLIYVLSELGNHIRTYWTNSNRIAAQYSPLIPFVGESNAHAASIPGYRADFPPFCRRLQYLAWLFSLAHIGWALFLALLFAI